MPTTRPGLCRSLASALQRDRASLCLRLILAFFDDALRLRLGGTPRLTDAEDRRALEAVARRAEPDRLLELLDRCLEADAQIDRRVQLVLILEALVDALGQKLSA